ncbi:MAG: ATP-binding cassette domain-containing protein [Pseudomonadota bacterium]
MIQSTPSDTAQNVPAFEVSGLRYAYGNQTALALDQCRLEQHSTMALIGPSGSGKSTLLHLLAGLLRPTSGSIRVLGQDLTVLKESEVDRFRGRHLGLVFQRLHLLPALTVRDNLLLATRLARVPLDPERYERLITQLGLADLTNRKPAELSMGQAQRAAIARSVIHGPALVLADEPTSALDDENARNALALLRDVTEAANAALLVVTHDQRIRQTLSSEFELKVAP